MKDFKTAFFLLRLPIAISLLGHGLVRIPKLSVFSDWMVTTMGKSMIPQLIIIPFSYALPFIEIALGIILLIGWQFRNSIYASLILMSILIFGSCTIENWAAIEAQLLHAFYFFALFIFYEKFRTEEP
ncbi:DoxX family protein [Chryseobacterium sp. MYb264]|uniref:DoxX family protein n=1 Tax=Chryseobacterium sp. MYb264 TaxID=2745153 RepID=UPI002E0EA3E3|nr:DoxX family protein [Chryseobacterium sp. MYb264]